MAIVACFVFQREISRSVFWDFFDSIDATATSANPPATRYLNSPTSLLMCQLLAGGMSRDCRKCGVTFPEAVEPWRSRRRDFITFV
jgi:hypothetical protein